MSAKSSEEWEPRPEAPSGCCASDKDYAGENSEDGEDPDSEESDDSDEDEE